nr:unnamed protein product [Callosobruchus analis]
MEEYIRGINYVPVDTLKISNVKEYNEYWGAKEVNRFFKLYHQNISSLRKNIDEARILFHQMNFEYDCIIFTETFMLPDANIFQSSGYDNMIYNDGKLNKNDGVVEYLKNGFDYEYKTIYVGYCEAIQIEIRRNKSKRIIVTALYRSPSASEDVFIESLEQYLQQTKNLDVFCHILVGDMNLRKNEL